MLRGSSQSPPPSAIEPAVQARHDAATNLEYAGAGLWIGVAMAGATFANALVHPYTLPAVWQLASLAMFGLAIGLTAWLVVRAAQPHAEAVPT